MVSLSVRAARADGVEGALYAGGAVSWDTVLATDGAVGGVGLGPAFAGEIGWRIERTSWRLGIDLRLHYEHHTRNALLESHDEPNQTYNPAPGAARNGVYPTLPSYDWSEDVVTVGVPVRIAASARGTTNAFAYVVPMLVIQHRVVTLGSHYDYNGMDVSSRSFTETRVRPGGEIGFGIDLPAGCDAIVIALFVRGATDLHFESGLSNASAYGLWLGDRFGP